eukprot:TRINITY_DN7568_c0_g2_i1.p1 TRINITY_DN7568_c0_g2~~TRINITY_DN7568_c0_g2_i1.p1  ORF type:complete len:1009 (-),score=135.77 TRINITY_DN7568_c0_g2_i1:268-3294(-)
MPFVTGFVGVRSVAFSVAAANAFFAFGNGDSVHFSDAEDVSEDHFDRLFFPEVAPNKLATPRGATLVSDDSHSTAKNGDVAVRDRFPPHPPPNKSAQNSATSTLAVGESADTETMAMQFESTMLELTTEMATLRKKAHNMVNAFLFMTEANSRPRAIMDEDKPNETDSGKSTANTAMAEASPRRGKRGGKAVAKAARRVWSPERKSANSFAQKQEHKATSSATSQSKQDRPDEVVRVMSSAATSLYSGMNDALATLGRASRLSDKVLNEDKVLRHELNQLHMQLEAFRRQQTLKTSQAHSRRGLSRRPSGLPLRWRRSGRRRQPRAYKIFREPRVRRARERPREHTVYIHRQPEPELDTQPPMISRSEPRQIHYQAPPIITHELDTQPPMISRSEPRQIHYQAPPIITHELDTQPPMTSRSKPRQTHYQAPPVITSITTVSHYDPSTHEITSEPISRFGPENVAETIGAHAFAEQQHKDQKDHILSQGQDADEVFEKKTNVTLCQQMALRCTPKPYEGCKTVAMGKDPETGCWRCVKWSCPDKDKDSFVEENDQDHSADKDLKSRSDKRQVKERVATIVMKRLAGDKHTKSRLDDRQVQKKAGDKRDKSRTDDRRTKQHADDKRTHNSSADKKKLSVCEKSSSRETGVNKHAKKLVANKARETMKRNRRQTSAQLAGSSRDNRGASRRISETSRSSTRNHQRHVPHAAVAASATRAAAVSRKTAATVWKSHSAGKKAKSSDDDDKQMRKRADEKQKGAKRSGREKELGGRSADKPGKMDAVEMQRDGVSKQALRWLTEARGEVVERDRGQTREKPKGNRSAFEHARSRAADKVSRSPSVGKHARSSREDEQTTKRKVDMHKKDHMADRHMKKSSAKTSFEHLQATNASISAADKDTGDHAEEPRGNIAAKYRSQTTAQQHISSRIHTRASRSDSKARRSQSSKTRKQKEQKQRAAAAAVASAGAAAVSADKAARSARRTTTAARTASEVAETVREKVSFDMKQEQTLL